MNKDCQLIFEEYAENINFDPRYVIYQSLFSVICNNAINRPISTDDMYKIAFSQSKQERLSILKKVVTDNYNDCLKMFKFYEDNNIKLKQCISYFNIIKNHPENLDCIFIFEIICNKFTDNLLQWDEYRNKIISLLTKTVFNDNFISYETYIMYGIERLIDEYDKFAEGDSSEDKFYYILEEFLKIDVTRRQFIFKKLNDKHLLSDELKDYILDSGLLTKNTKI